MKVPSDETEPTVSFRYSAAARNCAEQAAAGHHPLPLYRTLTGSSVCGGRRKTNSVNTRSRWMSHVEVQMDITEQLAIDYEVYDKIIILLTSN